MQTKRKFREEILADVNCDASSAGTAGKPALPYASSEQHHSGMFQVELDHHLQPPAAAETTTFLDNTIQTLIFTHVGAAELLSNKNS